jgi:hypothetical protein
LYIKYPMPRFGFSGVESAGMKKVVKQSADRANVTASHGIDFRRVRDDWPSTVRMALISSQITYGKKAPTDDAALIHGIGFAVGSCGARNPARIAMNTQNSHPALTREKPANARFVKR